MTDIPVRDWDELREKFDAAVRDMPDKIAKAMWDAGQKVGNLAVPRAPIRYGFLRGSWKVQDPIVTPGNAELEFGFYANYSWYVENMPYKHATGTQSHFLQSATDELAEEIENDIANAIDEAFREA